MPTGQNFKFIGFWVSNSNRNPHFSTQKRFYQKYSPKNVTTPMLAREQPPKLRLVSPEQDGLQRRVHKMFYRECKFPTRKTLKFNKFSSPKLTKIEQPLRHKPLSFLSRGFLYRKLAHSAALHPNLPQTLPEHQSSSQRYPPSRETRNHKNCHRHRRWCPSPRHPI